MKTLFAALLTLFLISTSSIAQTENDQKPIEGLKKEDSVTGHRAEINKVLDIYFEANRNKDFEKIMDMLYPKLFDAVPKEMMLQVFKQMEGEGMDFSINGADIKNISDMVEYEEEKFALVDYVLDMDMKFSGETYSKEVMGMMKGTFENLYGKENVKYDEENNAFSLKAKNSMFAIADKNSVDWKFIENKPQMEAILGQIIPEVVKKKLTTSKS